MLLVRQKETVTNIFKKFQFCLGPYADHTLGTEDGSYAFIDSSANRKINDTAVLVSQSMTDTSVNGMCIEFFYHM